MSKQRDKNRSAIVRVLSVLFTFHFSLFTSYAQTTFTQRLQQSHAGEGKVTVTQDKAIDDLVNGTAQPNRTSATDRKQADNKTTTTTTTATNKTPQDQKTTAPRADRKTADQKGSDAKASDPKTDKRPDRLGLTTTQQPDTTATSGGGDEGRKKVIKGGYKVNGFRVQVYAGGNSRDARIKAERIGKEINALFPGEPVYVHFYSPRWICRMGNYRTYEEAHEVLLSVKKLGYASAIIVKGKITVSSVE